MRPGWPGSRAGRRKHLPSTRRGLKLLYLVFYFLFLLYLIFPFVVLFYLGLVFFRKGLILYPRLTQNSLCSSGELGTHLGSNWHGTQYVAEAGLELTTQAD